MVFTHGPYDVVWLVLLLELCRTSARLTGEADLTKAINIYIFYPNIKRTNATSSSRLSSVLLRYICYLCCLSAHDFWHGTIMGGQVKIFNESTCLPDKV